MERQVDVQRCLANARTFIEVRGWTQAAFCRDQNGVAFSVAAPCDSMDEALLSVASDRAVCFCAYGATGRATGLGVDVGGPRHAIAWDTVNARLWYALARRYHTAMAAPSDAYGSVSVPQWQDNMIPDASWVLRLFDWAIEDEKAGIEIPASFRNALNEPSLT